MPHRYCLLFVSCFLVFFTARTAYGQFYKVYGYETLDAGELELVYWNSYVVSSDHQMAFFDSRVDREGLIAHSFEMEYGLSHRWTVGAYLDFFDPPGASLKYVRTKALVTYYRFYEKGSRPIDLGLYVEFIFPRKSYEDSEELEAKLILEKDFGSWRVDLNPTFEKKISGEEVEEGMDFNLAAGIYYRQFPWIQPGLEYYAKFGELREFRSWDEQQHVLFPTIDLIFKLRYHLHAGIGIGLNDGADDLTWKTIFSVEFK